MRDASFLDQALARNRGYARAETRAEERGGVEGECTVLQSFARYPYYDYGLSPGGTPARPARWSEAGGPCSAGADAVLAVLTSPGVAGLGSGGNGTA